MKKNRVIEILLGMILLILVLMMILITLLIGDSNRDSTTITNSYNKIYVINENSLQNSFLKEGSFNNKNYYNIWSNHKSYKEWDYYVENYKIYLHNYGSSRYFSIRVYFKDDLGKVKTYDLRKYIFKGETELFYFNDYVRDRYQYKDWSYQVLN